MNKEISERVNYLTDLFKSDSLNQNKEFEYLELQNKTLHDEHDKLNELTSNLMSRTEETENNVGIWYWFFVFLFLSYSLVFLFNHKSFLFLSPRISIIQQNPTCRQSKARAFQTNGWLNFSVYFDKIQHK